MNPQLFLSGGLITAGAILRWAVHRTNWHMVNLHTTGLILLVVGALGAILDLVLWEPWGPAFFRRRIVYTDRGWRRRWAQPTATGVDGKERTQSPAPPR